MFKGLYTALITPFHRDTTIDFQQYDALIDRQLDAGVDGIVIMGTTGESPTLSATEAQILIEKSIERTNGKTDTIIGTGTNCTRTTIEKSILAQELGASGIMVVNPYYNKPTQKGLIKHFTSVADAVSIPVLLYNIPGRTGVNLTLDTLRQLSKHPNIQGLKEASGNLAQIRDICSAFRDRADFSILSGDDELTATFIECGGRGVVSVLSNSIPQTLKEITDQLLDGDGNSGLKRFNRLLPLIKLCFIETNPIPIKTLMAQEGLCNEVFRLPLTTMLPDNRQKLLSALPITLQ